MLTSLKLNQYRNHKSAGLKDLQHMVCLIGPNGSGKTNILEAISYLAPGRGLRRASLSDICTHGQDGSWAVAAEITTDFAPLKIGTGVTPQSLMKDNPTRDIRIDGQKTASQAQLLNHIRMLWLTPAMDGIFTGPASDRRRFLDRWVTTFDPSHAQNLSQFEKAMRQRNKALETSVPSPLILDGLEELMANHAVGVALARHAHVERLQAALENEPKDSGFPHGRIALQGDLENAITEGTTITALEDDYRARLASERALDTNIGRTATGPHRSDFVVWHGPKAAEARLCSTGEQKALLIALLLAQLSLWQTLDSGPAQILLLDEVAAHLDKTRRTALFERLSSASLQVFMTGTDIDVFSLDNISGQSFLLDENGRITGTSST